MDSSEHDSYRAAIHGDREAFEMIIRTQSRALFAIAYGILQNREEAEDVVQDSLVKAWKMRWRVRDPEKFPAWLSMIARHRAHDVFRNRRSLPLLTKRSKQPRQIRLKPAQWINNYTRRSPRYRRYIAPHSLSVISKKWTIEALKTHWVSPTAHCAEFSAAPWLRYANNFGQHSLQRTESM